MVTTSTLALAADIDRAELIRVLLDLWHEYAYTTNDDQAMTSGHCIEPLCDVEQLLCSCGAFTHGRECILGPRHLHEEDERLRDN